VTAVRKTLVALASVALPLAAGCGPPDRSGEPEGAAMRPERERMVDHIEAYGMDDATVLEALRRVPRHEFVPPRLSGLAYADRPLPIGEGQTISQPYIVGLMTQVLDLQPTDELLEVGTGPGYQAAVLAEIVAEVYTIEIIGSLARRAEATLARLGYKNVHVRVGDGYRGWPEKAPFDAVIVTAAPDHVPEPLKQQLAVGARLVLPVGDRDQELLLITRTPDGFEEERLTAVRFVPMTGEAMSRPSRRR